MNLRILKVPSLNIQRIKLSFSSAIPRFWANNNVVITHFFNALSSVIPAGERFFMHTVRQAANHLEDEALQTQVQAFIAQESQHRMGHNAMNGWLLEKGYPISDVEQGVHQLLTWIEKHFSLKYQLALTVALEHFSSLLSDRFLRAKLLQNQLHPEFNDFLVAHCIEEIDHKAVAFDVYQAVYGSYWARVLMMLFVTVIFAPNVFRIQFIYLKHDKSRFNIKSWLSAAYYFWIKPGWFAQTIPGYLAFFSIRFHPWQLDNSQLIDEYIHQRETKKSHSGQF